MSNYPPGMTRQDWEAIDRPDHLRECPMSSEQPYNPRAECECREIEEEWHDYVAGQVLAAMHEAPDWRGW